MADSHHQESHLLDDNVLLEPGLRVRNPAHDEWGTGQIQSIIGTRITVNFENAGKLVVDGSVVRLDPLPWDDSLSA